MKKNSILKQCIALLVLCTMLVGLVPMNGQAAETAQSATLRKFALKTVMKREDRVKIRLTEPEISKYIIYRADAKTDGTVTGSYEEIMTMYGTNVSYVDEIEPGKYYSYKVYGYQKIDGKNTQVCVGQRLVYGGGYTMWDEYQHCDAKITPEQIPLRLNTEEGLIPAGYAIYRKEDGGKYQKIAKIETTDRYIEYVDEDVEAGKSYLYRARAYYYVNGKKVFTIYTYPVRLSAVNKVGIFEYEILTPVGEPTSEMVMKVTSEANNGELVFRPGRGWSELYYCTEYGYDGEEFEVALDLAEYSYDNQKWNGFVEEDEKLVIKGGETIYLRFATREGKEYVYLGEEAIGDTRLIYEEVSYNYLTSSLQFGYGTFSAEIIGEYYH